MGRKSGILLPISSLPSDYGIGSFSKEAYEFVDFLEKAGQSYWQILPLGQTGYGDSPYQSFSTFAGNPYFIDLDDLIGEGYISREDVSCLYFGSISAYVDYAEMYKNRYIILRKAYDNSPFSLSMVNGQESPEGREKQEAFEEFIRDNRDWLTDYALYRAVKREQGNTSYIEWEDSIRLRDPEAMRTYREKLADEIRFVEFQQYLFYTQWMALKDYANGKGIEIIGDLPIYVAFDSADTWSHPELFEFDEKGFPTVVAGVPPDAFSATGQLWGNPIYKWDYHKKTGYAWWMDRLSYAFSLYDVVRIDHFRGFDEYYAIPYGAETALEGEWRPGPGAELFKVMEENFGKKSIIAEDLGILTPGVYKLLEDTGYPGMKVLQFAFDTGEENIYLPSNYRDENCVVYTGTHDNDTTLGWYEKAEDWKKRFLTWYLREKSDTSFAGADHGDLLSPGDAVRGMIELAHSSRAKLSIIPMQDYLMLGSDARTNVPGVGDGNWRWQMRKDAFTREIIDDIVRMCSAYDRS